MTAKPFCDIFCGMAYTDRERTAEQMTERIRKFRESWLELREAAQMRVDLGNTYTEVHRFGIIDLVRDTEHIAQRWENL